MSQFDNLRALEAAGNWRSTPCIECTGARNAAGYGRQRSYGRTTTAHRAAMERHLGRKLAFAEKVCHRCDNPPCVNLRHLFVGTNSDNMQDMVAKGRANASKSPAHRQNLSASLREAHSSGRFVAKRGSEIAHAKLSDDKVRVILASKDHAPAVARALGVSPELVRKVRQRVIWTHVQPTDGEKP